MSLERNGPITFDFNAIPTISRSHRPGVDKHVHFVRLWMRFNDLRSIYPVKARRAECTMEKIMEIEKDPHRWVEVPDDSMEKTLEELTGAIGKDPKDPQMHVVVNDSANHD